MQDYTKLKVWQVSHQNVLAVYKLSACFPDEEKYELRSQVRRAAASVPLNIVEGSGKNSKKDFAKFLDISLASTKETEYVFLLAKDLDYISSAQYEKILPPLAHAKAMLINLIKIVRTK